jgi:hypothetical protein
MQRELIEPDLVSLAFRSDALRRSFPALPSTS